MIYIFTALYYEAQSLILHYNLKKNPEHTHFEVFCNEEAGICVTVTGTGEIAAATAVGSICALHGAGAGDYLVNLGSCAVVAAAEYGQIFLCNKLMEKETGKTFYPDILYCHDFPEAEIVTGMKVLNVPESPERGEIPGAGGGTAETISDAVLYDMEAAGIYQAGACFFAPHRMSFLKIVSDAGDAKNVTPEQIRSLMEEKKACIVSYIDLLCRVDRENRKLTESRTAHGFMSGTGEVKDGMLERLCDDLHCSAVMRSSVQQYFRYCELAGIDCETVVFGMYEDGRLPCRDKREGKVRFEELKRELL